MADESHEGEWLARAFVELSDTLATAFNLGEFLGVLVQHCVTLLEGPEVGLAIANPQGELRVWASSTDRMRALELIEIQHGEGPCPDCYQDGEQILNQRVDLAAGRWPRFTSLARDAGFKMLHALPMRYREQTIGAMNIFDVRPGVMSAHKANLIQSLADVATIGILQQRIAHRQDHLAKQLAEALKTRVLVEQAKGVTAEALGIEMDQAFSLLRGHARNNNLRLTDVASGVIGGTLAASSLLPIDEEGNR
jgi:transcriptional regulator with GAF, ATPase, and Fis domain